MSARPYRLTERVTPEAELQAAVCHLLDRVLLPPAVWFAMPLGHIKLTKQQGAKLTQMGAKRGLADIFILHERLFLIELKRRGSGLSKTQIVRTPSGSWRELVGQDQMFPKLERAGARIAVCHTPDEVVTALHRWRVPVRIASLERAA